MGEGEPESILVQRAQRYEGEALARIYDRHFDAIHDYISARVGNPVDAEDLTVQVFLRALDALPHLRARSGSLSGWLHRIANTLIIERMARLHWLPQAAPPPAHPAGSKAEGDPDRPEPQMDTEELRRAVNELSAEQQEVLTMRLVAGLEVAQIATATGSRQVSVEITQHRALRRLLDGLVHRGLLGR